MHTYFGDFRLSLSHRLPSDATNTRTNYQQRERTSERYAEHLMVEFLCAEEKKTTVADEAQNGSR